MIARSRRSATPGQSVAKQAELKSPLPLYQQRARERRRALAVSATAMLLIVASLATIVLVRANADRQNEVLEVAATTAAKPAPKPAKAPPPEPSKTASVAVEAPAASVKAAPTADRPTQSLAGAQEPVPEVGDAGPVPVDIAAAQQEAQAFTEAKTNDASNLLENVAEGTLPDEMTTAIPTPRPTDAAARKAKEPKDGIETASAAGADASGDVGTILRDVTMRASGNKNAAVVGTIPARATVELITCSSWCQVVYKGKRGWIYKGFVDR